MSFLLEKMSRWMPLFMGIIALAALVQMLNSFGVSVGNTILQWIGAHAWTIACVRLLAPSLLSRLLTCFLTVGSSITRVWAIS